MMKDVPVAEQIVWLWL